MAEGKKSFVLYCDVFHTVTHLTNEQAGQLFKHILSYVNDQNPETSDIVINLAFEPIKQQLKRDLKAWEETRVDRAHAGQLGGIKSGESRRAKQTKQVLQKRSKTKQTQANEAVTVNDTVNVNENTFYNIKRNFLNDYKWKEKFCSQKKIQMPALEILMNDFIADIDLKEDYKPLQELKEHFTNTYNKKQNGAHQQIITGGAKLGTSKDRLKTAKEW